MPRANEAPPTRGGRFGSFRTNGGNRFLIVCEGKALGVGDGGRRVHGLRKAFDAAESAARTADE